ncbi:MAG: SAM-dependent methyltransferase [Oligosphaeraceae bacterium]
MRPASPFRPSREFSLRLETHNRRWGAALENWFAHSGAAWTPGMIPTRELRMRLESFLPWVDFAASLRNVARAVLPSPEWVPRLLSPGSLDTILEFWEELGEPFRGRCAFSEEEVPALLCACADPPRFGTRPGRYPRQLCHLPPAQRLLDLGCGVGLGTWEAALHVGAREILGVTQEPLEAWMATRQRLPHDPQREGFFPPEPAIRARFLAGDCLRFRGEAPVEVILCNGLAGGRFLHRPEQLEALLDTLEANLSPGGVAALANAFHTGWQASVEELARRARRRGWEVQGEWQNLFLSPP